MRPPRPVPLDEHTLPDGVSADEQARRCGIATRDLRRILSGAPMSVEEATRLAGAIQRGALYWLALQVCHDLERLMRETATGTHPGQQE
ncbi:helix-turn-helix transcriptional regulator [Dyella telluris]|uniref:HigA family addiction module antidote protein n=1 Tax=Dyella telluris TaxID=2763498 RepID=A0A7G8Q3Z2_9GAMM|nr:hypothetical protein [Dyella telluris]QNK01500.1 hypothetical protein H8F01_21105 [Dyella telluris]